MKKDTKYLRKSNILPSARFLSPENTNKIIDFIVFFYGHNSYY